MRARPAIDRILARIAVDDAGCWNFTGATRNGYGVAGLGGRDVGIDYTHRVVYQAIRGPIPDGLHIDHLCRNRLCCNPDHLEPVTQAENNRRAYQHRPPKTHCKHGHEFTPENTGKQTTGGRRCITCNRESARRSLTRKKAA